MKIFLRLVAFVVAMVVIYNLWVLPGVPQADQILAKPVFEKEALVSIGTDSGKGNIVGMQPYLTPLNYATIPTFRESMRAFLMEAKKQNILSEKTVVVFPAYIGTWLYAYEQKESLYTQTTVANAMTQLVASNIFKFSFEYLTAPAVTNKSSYAALAMKGKQAGKIYQDVFSDLAKEFNVTIAAGTMVLPEPSVSADGKLVIKKGPLYNTAVVFNADGKIISPLIKKLFPMNEEIGFLAGGDETQTPVISTPAGKLGILVGSDSWYPAAYKNISTDVKMIIVPSLEGTDSLWNAPWKGFNGFKAPTDIDTADYGKITEGEAWQKYSMGSRAVKAGVHYGMNVFFSGKIWDRKLEGRVLVLHKDSLTVLPPVTTGRIVNLWLN